MSEWNPVGDNTGMRYPEQSDLTGGATDATPAPLALPEEPEVPTPEYTQRIIFEGCECAVMSPEDYEALWAYAKKLRAYAKQEHERAEGLAEQNAALCDEMAKIAIHVGRSKTDGRSDCDWFELSDDVKKLLERERDGESRTENLLAQARKVRNYSNPHDVFEAVPVRFIRGDTELNAALQAGETKHE